MNENVERVDGFSQVCVWPGVAVSEPEIEDFVKFFSNQFGVRVQYLETITTAPDTKDGFPIEVTGGRSDTFFAVHIDDAGKFALQRIQMGIRWVEDVLSPINYDSKIYPQRVQDYCSW